VKAKPTSDPVGAVNMKKSANIAWIAGVVVLCLVMSVAQNAPKDQKTESIPNNAADAKQQQELEAASPAMSDMRNMDHGQDASTHHMHMNGAHMHMSTLRTPHPGDQEKADRILDEVKLAMTQWKDSRAAERDGFKIFLPNIPQPEYHFTNWKYAVENQFHFNPSHPTSLLFKKTGPDQFELVGAMFTAPKRFTEDQINERVPLSITQWHLHTNFCQAPKGREKEYLGKDAKFGLMGSISTQAECDKEGGKFSPILFNWMVHVYPYEKSQDAIWVREMKMDGMPGMDHDH